MIYSSLNWMGSVTTDLTGRFLYMAGVQRDICFTTRTASSSHPPPMPLSIFVTALHTEALFQRLHLCHGIGHLLTLVGDHLWFCIGYKLLIVQFLRDAGDKPLEIV